MAKRAVAGALLAAALLFSGTACNSKSKPTIHDAAFEKAADALCNTKVTPLRAPKPDKGVEDPFGGGGPVGKDDVNGVATKIESVANGLDQVQTELGALTVRSADRLAVTTWFEDWSTYTSVGRQYATAVREKSTKRQQALLPLANETVLRIGKFARANNMPHCVL